MHPSIHASRAGQGLGTGSIPVSIRWEAKYALDSWPVCRWADKTLNSTVLVLLPDLSNTYAVFLCKHLWRNVFPEELAEFDCAVSSWNVFPPTRYSTVKCEWHHCKVEVFKKHRNSAMKSKTTQSYSTETLAAKTHSMRNFPTVCWLSNCRISNLLWH